MFCRANAVYEYNNCVQRAAITTFHLSQHGVHTIILFINNFCPTINTLAKSDTIIQKQL